LAAGVEGKINAIVERERGEKTGGEEKIILEMSVACAIPIAGAVLLLEG
jgi:hypothetical protein